MGLVKEPMDVDFVVDPKPLTEDEKKVWQDKFSLPEITENILPEIFTQLKSSDLEWIASFTGSSNQAKTSCQVCLEVCPIKDAKPIVFLKRNNPDNGKDYIWPSVTKNCVGCGVCEEKCPTPVASITISPQLKWSERQAENQP